MNLTELKKMPVPELNELAQSMKGHPKIFSALFINLARDPMGHLTRQGKQMVSERIDPLSFGGAWESLAVTFDQILVSSWHEVLTFRFSGESGLMDCVTDHLAWHPISGNVK